MLATMIVKVKSGPRTDVSITVEHRSVNEKRIVFANGRSLSEYDIGKWIMEQLYAQLAAIEKQGAL